MFCSGSDDATVKVFNYEKQRVLCTFQEHLDYVRSVQFHNSLPFIVSASDDQTIRIFNWETRAAVSILSGHNHYVMSAFFHPTAPLILSASLDDTLRVWDVSGLFNAGGHGAGLFALTDAVLKFQAEEHVSGVNWACWHPSRDLAVSCSDDQTVKVWHLTETDFSPVVTLRSHCFNVSCAVFHPTLDVIFSASEDHTVRVWDSKRFVHLGKYRRQDDRFWVVAAHPKWPIFAAGHDTGLSVLRLMRQRPAFDVAGGSIFYYCENAIHKYSVEQQTDAVVGHTRPMVSGSRPSPVDPPPRKFAYSAVHNKLLVGHEETFELHALSGKDAKSQQGHDPVWVTRNQFAALTRAGLALADVNGGTGPTVAVGKPLRLFPARTGSVFLSSVDQVTLFDTQGQRAVASRVPVGAVRVCVTGRSVGGLPLGPLGHDMVTSRSAQRRRAREKRRLVRRPLCVRYKNTGHVNPADRRHRDHPRTRGARVHRGRP
jgi:coatomer protein complex subunit alpha (xenin)